MIEPRILEVRTKILKKNDELAREMRRQFESLGLLVVNMVSSPGTGKTSFLRETLSRLRARSIPIAAGRPGLMASRQKTSRPPASIAAFTWSASPVESPPEVSSRSCVAAASRSAAAVASWSSGRMPRSQPSTGRRCSSASRVKRFES